MIAISINRWSSHLNMILYSLLLFSEKCKEKFKVEFNASVPDAGAVLEYKNKIGFLDYSDSPEFLAEPSTYRIFLKRSLLIQDQSKYKNVYPLGFHVNYTYKPEALLKKLNIKSLLNPANRTEIIRAADYFGLITNNFHAGMDIRKFPCNVKDNGGRVIYSARLWDPERVRNDEEKSRRKIMNEFRVGTCRIIKESFKDSISGLEPDYYARQTAPDILLKNSQTTKGCYLKNLSDSDICIADDGLKDTLGWKIGEYVLFGKAIITTPVNILVPGFHENINFLSLGSRSSFEEIPDKVRQMLTNKKYLSFAKENIDYAIRHLHPMNYASRILNMINIGGEA